MMCRLVVASMVLAGAASNAVANGRPPQASTINFQLGNEQQIVAGMSFGVTVSRDGGATWHWMCEAAVHYGGIFDPDYAYASNGAVFATTFERLYVNRDGCRYEPTAHGDTFITAITLGPDGALYAAAAQGPDAASGDPGDVRIYKSTDGGETFPAFAMPGVVGDWWSSIEVAPSDASRTYLSGYRIENGTRTILMFRSDDGGATYDALTGTGLVTTRDSELIIAGIGKNNPELVFARVTFPRLGVVSDAVYRSTDGGETWVLVLDKSDTMSLVVRANGDVVAAGRDSSVYVSRAPSNGDEWTELVGAPSVNCLVETSVGEVWACTQNFSVEDAGIMKTTDLVTWTKVLRYQEIRGPVECPVGTEQHDQCVAAEPSQWCGLRAQFGIVEDPTSCPAVVPDLPPTMEEARKDGCCQSGRSAVPGPAAWIVGIALARRRRKPRHAAGAGLASPAHRNGVA